MKLLSTVAAGALLLAGCAPFEHGHYANDVDYINDVGDRPGTPVIVDAGYSGQYQDAYSQQDVASYRYSEPAYEQQVYSAPAPAVRTSFVEQASYVEPSRYVEPASYVEPLIHSEPRFEVAHHQPQTFVEPFPYIEPASTFDYEVEEYEQPRATPQVHVEIHNTVAPAVAALPVAKPLHYVSAPAPIVAATSVSVAEERYIGETRYAPPEVINAPPVFMRGPGQFSNQPFPDPAYPQFGALGMGYPQPAPQGFGFPPQPGFGYGNPYGMPVAANARPVYPQQGYGNPHANNGCTTTCGGTPVF